MRDASVLPHSSSGSTIAWVFRLILLLSVLLITVLGVWLDRRFGPSPYHLCGLLAALFLVAALHPLAIAGCFIISSRWRDQLAPEQRLSLWQTLAMFDREIDASARGLVWANPFRGHRPAPLPAGEQRRHAVLFLHGYFCNRSVWRAAMEYLAAHGFLVEAMTLEPAFGDLEAVHDSIEEAIGELLARQGHDRLVLVAHSMGGIAARSYLEASGDSRVRQLICLGSPHQGTVMAHAGHARNTRQIRRNSPWLSALNLTRRFPRSRILNLYSVHDSIVFPSTTSHLEGADNRVLHGIGHVSLLYHAKTHDAILRRLLDLERSLDQPAATEGTATP